ncbi:MAG: hypothetical protein LBL39_03385 [Planctomycetaceae bacterium]|jgi:hypothetical protein|nr:hypothetical protein [Planctomycetaceae bacterium]
MFKKLIERIDAVNEYINPIVVRDMRATLGHLQCSSLIIAYACFLIMICLIGYFLCDLDSFEQDLSRLKTDDSADSIGSMFMVVLPSVMLPFLVSFVMLFINVTRNLYDETFLITALTPRQYLHAYMFETFIYTFFCTSLLAPVVLIIFGRALNFLFLAAVMYCGNVLITQTIILVILSFTARLKAQTHIVVALFCMLGVIFSISITFWCFCAFFPLFAIALRDHLKYFILPIIFISALISLLLVGSLAYKLSSRAIETRKKSILRMFFFNIFCYVLLGIAVSVICFCTVFWVFSA